MAAGETCLVRWSRQGEQPSTDGETSDGAADEDAAGQGGPDSHGAAPPEDYEFEREIYMTVDGHGEEEAFRRRLSNLGFVAGDPPEEA